VVAILDRDKTVFRFLSGGKNAKKRLDLPSPARSPETSHTCAVRHVLGGHIYLEDIWMIMSMMERVRMATSSSLVEVVP